MRTQVLFTVTNNLRELIKNTYSLSASTDRAFLTININLSLAPGNLCSKQIKLNTTQFKGYLHLSVKSRRKQIFNPGV